MERARRRNSISASGVEGVHQVQKHKAVSRLSLDSRSYFDGCTRNDMFMLDLGQSSDGRATGRLIKKLLAEEMFKEIESGRRSPSGISRLMVLEGNVRKQQKRISDSYESKKVSINVQPNRQLYDAGSFRRSPILQQEFDNVPEDLKASHEANRCCSSRWRARSMLTKSEMALIWHKFIDSERLSDNDINNEKLRGSKELNDTLNNLDGKELLMKYVHKQDSLFASHLHNPSHPDGSHAKFSKCENHYPLEAHNRRRAHISGKSSKVLSEEKNELPVRIVVLRSNHLGNKHSSGTSGSSHYLSHGYEPNFRQMKENTSVGDAEKVSRRRVSDYDIRFSKSSSKEARKIAREITRRMRGGFDAPESDFDSDPEMFNLLSRYSFGDDNKWGRYPSSSSVEWSVNREGKKRLSERWKITHRYEDLEIVRKGSSLREMLAIYDEESRSKHYDHNASSRCSKSNFAKKYRSHKEVFSSQDSKSRSKKSLPCQHIYNNEINSLSEAYSEIQMEANVKDLSEKQLMFSEPGSTTNSSILHQKRSSVIDNDKAAAHDQEVLCLQYLGAEPASSENSKEADHASPVSVLEVPFIEDASSCSESFENVSAEQNEGNYTLAAEGWESSYALDALIHSGLLEFGFDTFTTKWYSPNCPLDPMLFDDLDKKYNNEITGLSSERRLLFDRLNSALLDIFQKHVDLCPWVRPKLAGLYYSIWRKERVADVLEKLIKQESANAQEQEIELDKEMQWLDYKGEIDAIGNEIERLLIHDMICELSW